MAVPKVTPLAEYARKSRGERLWKQALKNRDQAKLSLARALLLLESYRETEGLPTPIRRARALEKILNGIPIFIDPDELLVGAFSAKPMYFEWYPEYAVDQEMLSQDLGEILAENHTQKDIATIIDYFKDSCLQNSFFALLDDARKAKIKETCEDGAWVYRARTTLDIDRGYHSVDHEKAIQKGFLGVLAEVEEELGQTAIVDDDSLRKVDFLKGLAIVLKAGIRYAGRYADLARALAKKASGSRRSELETIAAVCDRVPAQPARSFQEAIQTSLFLHILIHLESRAQESPGRMDQFLYPSYQQDLREGRITPEYALELLECYRVKLSTLRLFSSIKYKEIVSGEAQYHNVTLGGQTADGRDATNELSYLFLKAAEQTRTPHPTLSIRYHDNMPKEFALKGLELVRGGLGFPAFFNDKSNIPWLLSTGATLEEARTHCISGCVHGIVPGRTSPFDVLFISIAKCLELALHNGFDPRTEKQLGPQTGDFGRMGAYDDLFGAFKAQVEHFSREGGAIIGEQRVYRSQRIPALISSAFTDDCIGKGKTCLADGARYTIIIQAPVGMIDAVDSLAAIRKCVFEDGAIGRAGAPGGPGGELREPGGAAQAAPQGAEVRQRRRFRRRDRRRAVRLVVEDGLHDRGSLRHPADPRTLLHLGARRGRQTDGRAPQRPACGAPPGGRFRLALPGGGHEGTDRGDQLRGEDRPGPPVRNAPEHEIPPLGHEDPGGPEKDIHPDRDLLRRGRQARPVQRGRREDPPGGAAAPRTAQEPDGAGGGLQRLFHRTQRQRAG